MKDDGDDWHNLTDGDDNDDDDWHNLTDDDDNDDDDWHNLTQGGIEAETTGASAVLKKTRKFDKMTLQKTKQHNMMKLCLFYQCRPQVLPEPKVSGRRFDSWWSQVVLDIRPSTPVSPPNKNAVINQSIE